MNSIRQARRRLGLSQVELAEAAGVSPATVVELEGGHRQPQGRTLRKLSAALGVEVVDLVEEEALAPPKAGPLSLEWARTASDAEFYRLIMTTPDEDTDRLGKLSGELHGFLSRPVRRILTERNNKTFEDTGPEPTRDESERLKERAAALRAEVNRRPPLIAWLRMSDDGNVCRWFIPPDEWEEYRADVNKFFAGAPYMDVDAGEDDQVHEVPLYAHA